MLRKSLLSLVLILTSSQAMAFGSRGSWVASGGFGLTLSPTLVLINPQLEYVSRPNLMFGPMVQLGIGDATLFTASGTVRFLLGNHPKLKPSLEGGLGLAVASAFGASSVGVLVHMGLGFDYLVDPGISVGTMIRANLAPPLKTFFVSWPILVARFAI